MISNSFKILNNNVNKTNLVEIGNNNPIFNAQLLQDVAIADDLSSFTASNMILQYDNLNNYITFKNGASASLYINVFSETDFGSTIISGRRLVTSGTYILRNTITLTTGLILDDNAMINITAETLGLQFLINMTLNPMILSNLTFNGILIFYDIIIVSQNASVFDIKGLITPLLIPLLSISRVGFNNCLSIGTIQNVTFTCTLSSFGSCGVGINLIDCTEVNLINIRWFQGLNLPGSILSLSGTINNARFFSSAFEPDTNETIFNFNPLIILPNRAIISGNTNTIVTRSFAIGGLDQFSNKLFIANTNINIPPSRIIGNMIINTPVNLSIAVISTPVVINDVTTSTLNTWTPGIIEGFTFDSNTGTLTYDRIDNISVQVIASSTIAKTGGGLNNIGTKIALNGSPISSSYSITRNTQPTNVTSVAVIQITQNDTISLMGQNDSGTSDISILLVTFIVYQVL